jgi:phenylpyruvate tautomerase PptA (4-oxalocrotonate tautomerase family)
MIKGLTEVAHSFFPKTPKSAFFVFLREHENEKVGVAGLPYLEF